MATAKVRQANRPSGASSSCDGASETFAGGRLLGCLLLPWLGLVLVVARDVVAVAAYGLGLVVPAVAAISYMGLMVLKGRACLSTHCNRARGFH